MTSGTKAQETFMIKQVLTIAGSDSGGGAGIQADLKAMSANGVYAMSVITAITAQNTEEVTDVFELPTSIIAAQLDAIFDDFDVAAVKTGMLSSTDIIKTVVTLLKPQQVKNLVVDPVMIAKGGQALLKPDAIDTIKKELFPLALLVTPNVHEAQQLSGIEITSLADARRAAKTIHQFGCANVLIKGGHLASDRATDLLYDGCFFNIYKGEFIDTPHTHGTGCTFASAIAAHIARGKTVPDAVQTAKTYLTEAIRHSLAIGHGKGPTNHFFFLNQGERYESRARITTFILVGRMGLAAADVTDRTGNLPGHRTRLPAASRATPVTCAWSAHRRPPSAPDRPGTHRGRPHRPGRQRAETPPAVLQHESRRPRTRRRGLVA